MEVYSKIVIDMPSGEILEVEKFEYEGKLVLAKGPSMQTTKTTVSPPPLTDAEKQSITQQVREALGARGVVSSGVGISAEQEALRKEEESRRPTITKQRSPSPPRGFMGLK